MLNKNISIWRGTQTPPTNYHLWEKEDGGLYIYLDEKWQQLVSPTDKITLDKHQKQLDKIKNLTLTEINPTDNNTYKSYQLKSDDNIFGETINIPKDRFIKQVALGYGNATMDSSTGLIDIGTGLSKEYLLFSVALQSGSYELVSINLTNFLTEKDYSDGLEIVDNKLKIKVDSSSEEYLKVSNAGIKVEGINTNFNKVNERLTTISNAQIKRSEMGVANGIATLNSNGVIPYNQLPAIADDEDLIEVNNRLKLKDKVYDPDNFSGKGYVILRKNIVEGKNILTQDMINEPNTVYEIRYDFDLNDTEIQIKDGCVLNFVGGSLNNGKLSGINVKLNTDNLNSSLINITYNNKFIWNKNSTYFIEPKLWGITEGYFEKDENGHYSEAQYQRMYKNGVGFTNAIEWAYKNNYKGVVFKRGDYCFCSRLNSAGRSRACIFVRNIIDFDINLGGAKLYLLKDSNKQSPYSEITLDDPFAERGVVIMMQMVKNVQIHDGEIIGDRFLRNYTNIKESQFDKTNGIMQEGFCYNTKLYNLSIRNFMGDAIALWIGGNFLIYEDYNTLKTIGQNIKISSRKYVETRFLSGVKNEVTSYRNNVGCTITDYIDLKNFYNNITVNENYKILEYFKKNRLYSFISQGTTINAYWTKIDILTFNEAVSTEIPIRVIP